jgi:hypothetical protein
MKNITKKQIARCLRSCGYRDAVAMAIVNKYSDRAFELYRGISWPEISAKRLAYLITVRWCQNITNFSLINDYPDVF